MTPGATFPARYPLLDGLRGLAALGVVVSHVLGIVNRGPALLGRASVLWFFVISGYCITASAQRALRQRLPFSRFMWRRFRRIYPTYWLALVYFVATRLAKSAAGMGGGVPTDPIAWLQNLTLTQWVTGLFHPARYPALGPLFSATFWSLCYEEQFYLVVAAAIALAVRGGPALGRSLLVVSLAAAAWNALWPDRVHGIFLDYWLPFAAGALVFHRLTTEMGPRTRFVVDAGLAGFAVIAGAFGAAHGIDADPNTRHLWLEWSSVATFALALILLRPVSDGWISRSPGRWLSSLGLISYSLYLVQAMNYRFSRTVAGWIVPAGAPFAVRAVAEIAVHVLAAIPFWYACERHFLTKPPPRGQSPEAGGST